MNRIFTAFVISALLSIAVFGVFMMGHGEEGNAHGCLAATAQGTADCPNQTNSLAFITFHLDSFRSFSTAAFAPFMAGMLAFLFAFFSIIRASHALFGRASRTRAFFVFARRDAGAGLGESFRQWLTFHENSPNAI